MDDSLSFAYSVAIAAVLRDPTKAGPMFARARVEEFDPPHRLAWSGTAPGSAGYHAWVIERRGQRTRIVTEETQRGIIPFVGQLYLRRAIARQHQRWVDELARRAASGLPA